MNAERVVEAADTATSESGEGENSVVRRLRNHPPGNRAPSAVARLALVRDEVGVIAVLNFVPEGFDMFRH